MKKIFTALAFYLLAASAYGWKFDFSVSDTFGGNTDTLEGGQAFSLFYDKTEGYNSYFSIADRLQLDFESKILTARGRLDAYISSNPKIDKGMNFKGFVNFSPVVQFGVAAGNSFFNQFGMECGQLYALEDTPSSGKLLKSGIALYSEIPFSDSPYSLKSMFGFEWWPEFTNTDQLLLGGGIEFSKKKTFSVGATARNFTAGEFGHYAIFAGVYPSNFTLNAGFIYNNSSENLLPAETKYSLLFSGGYKNKNLGLEISGDFVTGLTTEYLAGNSKTTKTYDGYFPNLLAFRANKKILNNLETGLFIKLTNLVNKPNSSVLTLNPKAEFSFASDHLTLDAGLKFVFDFSQGGISEFSLPVSLKYKYKYKHKNKK